MVFKALLLIMTSISQAVVSHPVDAPQPTFPVLPALPHAAPPALLSIPEHPDALADLPIIGTIPEVEGLPIVGPLLGGLCLRHGANEAPPSIPSGIPDLNGISLLPPAHVLPSLPVNDIPVVGPILGGLLPVLGSGSLRDAVPPISLTVDAVLSAYNPRSTE
ncbi:hypothetical protein BU17DRAFT_60522 [Hysterangium stoloniferum]|nr:hypothetical protein BU17DRAFT_60522 [Hysterangium stoloniferum]